MLRLGWITFYLSTKKRVYNFECGQKILFLEKWYWICTLMFNVVQYIPNKQWRRTTGIYTTSVTRCCFILSYDQLIRTFRYPGWRTWRWQWRRTWWGRIWWTGERRRGHLKMSPIQSMVFKISNTILRINCNFLFIYCPPFPPLSNHLILHVLRATATLEIKENVRTLDWSEWVWKRADWRG